MTAPLTICGMVEVALIDEISAKLPAGRAPLQLLEELKELEKENRLIETRALPPTEEGDGVREIKVTVRFTARALEAIERWS